MKKLDERISDLIAAIGEGATNRTITDAIMKEVESVFSDGCAAMDHFGSHHRDDLSKREQAPEDLADRDCKSSTLADLHPSNAAVGTSADEPIPVVPLHPQPFQVAAGLKSTQAMRDRIRELMTDPQDDYDRAVAFVLDDLEHMLNEPQEASMREALSEAHRALVAFKDAVIASDQMKGREYVGLGIQVNDAIDKARLALSEVPR